MTFTQSTFPESKSSHLKRWHPKRKSSLLFVPAPPNKKRETLVAEGAEVLSRLIKLIPKMTPFGKEIHFPRPVIFGIHSLTFGGLISIQYLLPAWEEKNLSRSWTFQQVILYMWRKKTPKNLQKNLNSPIHLFPWLLLSGGSSSINLEWGIGLQIG